MTQRNKWAPHRHLLDDKSLVSTQNNVSIFRFAAHILDRANNFPDISIILPTPKGKHVKDSKPSPLFKLVGGAKARTLLTGDPDLSPRQRSAPGYGPTVPKRSPGASHDPPWRADLGFEGELFLHVLQDRRRHVGETLQRETAATINTESSVGGGGRFRARPRTRKA